MGEILDCSPPKRQRRWMIEQHSDCLPDREPAPVHSTPNSLSESGHNTTSRFNSILTLELSHTQYRNSMYEFDLPDPRTCSHSQDIVSDEDSPFSVDLSY